MSRFSTLRNYYTALFLLSLAWSLTVQGQTTSSYDGRSGARSASGFLSTQWL